MLIGIQLHKSRDNHFAGKEYDLVMVANVPSVWCIKDGKMAFTTLLVNSEVMSGHESKLLKKFNDCANVAYGVPDIITKAFGES